MLGVSWFRVDQRKIMFIITQQFFFQCLMSLDLVESMDRMVILELQGTAVVTDPQEPTVHPDTTALPDTTVLLGTTGILHPRSNITMQHATRIKCQARWIIKLDRILRMLLLVERCPDSRRTIFTYIAWCFISVVIGTFVIRRSQISFFSSF